MIDNNSVKYGWPVYLGWPEYTFSISFASWIAAQGVQK